MSNKITINKGSVFVWDKLFKKEIIDRGGLRFDTNIAYGEDIIFIVEYKMICSVISFVHKDLYYYTENRSDSATGSNKLMFDLIVCMEKLVEKSFKHGRYREVIGQIGDIAAGYYCRRIFSFVRDPDPRKDKFIRDFQTFFKAYIPNWKEKVCKYRSRGSSIKKFINKYRLSILGVNAYIMSIRMAGLYSKVHKTIISNYKKTNKYINDHAVIDRYAFYRNMPVRDNDVLFASFFGSSISDSMFYMIKDMQQKGKNIIIATNYKNRDKYFCKVNKIKACLVTVNTPEYLEALARSKYLVLNSRFPTYFNKRQGQVLLNTWHGTPLKTLGRAIRKGLSDLGNNQCQFLMSDYLSFPNEYTKEHTFQDFSLNKLFQGKSVLCGYPRNSIFFHEEHIEEMRKNFGVADKKVFVYMPTWRGETLNTRSVQKYEKEVINILNTLDKKVEDNTVIYVKLHQVVMNKIHLSSYKHIRCFDGSYDTYHFLSMADCLITDYSSVMFDFVNANKPTVLFMYDYDEYMRTRGMYIDVKSLGFEQVFSTDDLVNFIKEFKHTSCVYQSEQDNFCAYDSVDTPALLNEVLLRGQPQKQVKIEDHSTQNNKEYNLYLMPQLTTEDKVRRFLEIKQTDPDAVFVFAQETFTRKTEKILQKYNNEITYIITPTKGVHSTLRLIHMQMAMFGALFAVKKAQIEEINRISRGINVGKVINISNYKFFKFLSLEV